MAAMVNQEKIKIGIIGGSGLENPEILKSAKKISVTTKYGKPSSKIITGKIEGIPVAILSRHGSRHEIPPSFIPNQANIAALKKLGCTHIIATTACGSLRHKIRPGDFVFLDQFIDRTIHRRPSMYWKELAFHIPMAEPFCSNLRKLFTNEARKLKFRYHPKGTVVTIEGPRYASLAESLMFRSWGADVINMSTVPEVVLARESGMHYASIAMSTDYDCWKKSERVDVNMVIKTMNKNVDKVVKLILKIIPKIKTYLDCPCEEDFKHAVQTKD